MTGIVVLGGGVSGLSAGLMLARDGHEVTVLERDAAPAPESGERAWEDWSRDGVTQFRQAHLLAAAGCAVLQDALPDVHEALVAAGARHFDPVASLPPTLPDRERRPGDERFATFTARRPIIEQCLARAAQSEPRLQVRRGAGVTQLTLDSAGAGVPHVTGVRLDGGEQLDADLVIDAMGRRSQLPRWCTDAGLGTVHEESEDSGFIYYTRYFRSTDGTIPPQYGPPLAPIGTFSILTIPADNDTWSVTTYVSAGDQALKRMREADAWAAVLRACPAHAHWLDGEPISDVMAMGGVVDRYRRLSRDGQPLITGIAMLGDAWACTNPSLGRGMTLGLLHARCLRETVAAHLDDDPLDFAAAWEAVTEQKLTPWYRETVEEDRERLREIEALRSGVVPEPPSERKATLRRALQTAMLYDADLFRVFLESRVCLTPLDESFARPGVAERIVALAGEHEPLTIPGPSRDELLALLA
jgi:2-polyprenyl-6-methoxyphenol hydroxylase-like FAD-dependent oxidoreductase